MNEPSGVNDSSTDERFWRPDAVLAVTLFAIAAAAVGFAMWRADNLLPSHGWPVAAFFLLFGVFTISMGYTTPNSGHVSFDRVAQIASILIFGPLDAAWINGLASLLYPWQRLFSGKPLRAVLVASLYNAAMMTIIILVCGTLYVALGGPAPLTGLNLPTVGLLLLLVVSMQLLNDIGMLAFFYSRDRTTAGFFNFFTTAVETSSGFVAMLVAIVFNRMELSVVVLLLAVLSLGMLLLRQFANMRYRLEGIVAERTEALHEKSLELERQATHDKLTGLHNRRYADDYLQRELANARRYGHPFTVALADIDYFKSINDRFSHAKGDEVLIRVARLLADRCRETDMISRHGGEEFLLCFPGTDAARARWLCEELRAAVEGEDWTGIGPGVSVTLSFGVAQTTADLRRATLLGIADRRLYEAKHQGRNRVVA